MLSLIPAYNSIYNRRAVLIEDLLHFHIHTNITRSNQVQVDVSLIRSREKKQLLSGEPPPTF